MELFQRAKTVRLRSKHDKFLVAEEDEECVAQERGGGGTTARRARWTVEPVEGAGNVIRLRSCYGRYLTASSEPFPLAGKKVTQTLPPAHLQDAGALEWEPVREGVQVKLRTRDGKYLRANGGLPPWRNSVTHDLPHRTATQDWVLWDVEIVEVLPQRSSSTQPTSAAAATPNRPSPTTSPPTSPPLPPPPTVRDTSGSTSSQRPSRLESLDSSSGRVGRVDGRTIFYAIANGEGAVDESIQWPHLVFNGTSVPELTELLKEKTQLDDIIICLRSPLNQQQLLPITLRLPPSNAAMRLVVMDANSRGAGERF